MEKNNSFLPLLCGFVVSTVLTFIVVMTTWNFGVVYEHRIQLFNIAVSLLWGILVIKSKGWKQYKTVEIAVAILFFVCLAIYMGNNGWHTGYITNTPLIGINSERDGIQRDTLYHNALASSIEYYGYPSLLVNSGAFHDYHFGSHMILGLLSRIMGMPTIFTYCYLYPIIFFSAFPSLVLSVAYDVRALHRDKKNNSFLDILVLLGFMTFYTYPQSVSGVIGDGKSFSWLSSESFCVAIVLGLLFFKICVWSMNRGWFDHKRYSLVFSVIIVPIFIVITSLSKISVGLIHTFMICYYLFRKKGWRIKYILLEAFYVILAFTVHFLPTRLYSPILSGTNEEIYNLKFLANMRQMDPQVWGLHILSLFFYALVFIIFRLRNISTFKELKSAVRNSEIVIEEALFMTCIVGALPGMFIEIGGGSAFYFFSIQRVIAVTLLLAYNVPYELSGNIKIEKNFIQRVAAWFIGICLSFNFLVSARDYARVLIQDCRMASAQREEAARDVGFWNVVKGINEITKDNKSDYYIYICESASIWSKYSNPDSALFFYPALTGIVCIGELYFENGQLYTNNGTEKNGFYYYKPLVEDRKMTEKDAYQKAKEDGKQYIIYIFDDTFAVKDVV